MKYKVGDKVRIREDLEVGKEYNSCTFIIDMKKYKGEIATITYCYNDDSYDIDLDEGAWFWADDMLKDIDDVATTDMNTVDIGYYLEYCGHKVIENVYYKVIENVYYGGYAHDNNHVYCTTADSKNQYTLPVNSIEFIVPHED